VKEQHGGVEETANVPGYWWQHSEWRAENLVAKKEFDRGEDNTSVTKKTKGRKCLFPVMEEADGLGSQILDVI